MVKDLRGWLDYLEKQDMLVRVKKEVDTKYEIAAGIRKTSDIDGPALLFENIKNYPNWKVAGGIFAPRRLLAMALGVVWRIQPAVRRYGFAVGIHLAGSASQTVQLGLLARHVHVRYHGGCSALHIAVQRYLQGHHHRQRAESWFPHRQHYLSSFWSLYGGRSCDLVHRWSSRLQPGPRGRCASGSR